MKLKDASEKDIKIFKEELLSNYDAFNALNKNIYKDYVGLSNIYKNLEIKNIKIFWDKEIPIFMIWFDHRIYGTFINSLVPLFKLKDYKNINYNKLISSIENNITYKKDRNLYEYITEDNILNNFVLQNLSFKKVDAIVEMNMNIEGLKSVSPKEKTKRKKLNFTKTKEGILENHNIKSLSKRVQIQNKIFDAKDRFPLSKSDVFLDMKSKNYIEELSFFYKQNNKKIGYCQIGLYNKGYCLINFGIVPKYREKGYGLDFLNKVLLKAKEYGIKDLNLTVNKSNEKAINLYSKFGFEKKREETTWHFRV